MEQAISPLSMTEGTVITPAGPEPGLRDVDQNISLVFYKSTSVRSARCCRIQQGKPCFFRLRLRSSSHVPSNHAVYEKYFRQVESGNTGRVLAADAAQFLKKSGLADLILGKIWDLADKESKGYLNKQEFFAALQLVACAQNGMEVSLSSLKAVVPPPKFHDNESPLLVGPAVSADVPWSVKVEEKSKYDAIFDSLIPANGFLSGDKVKPVLLNSKLSVEVLGRVWELSDIDRDGLLDRDEFAVAMFLVYSALEKEPVPMSLPPALVPPSKRKPIQSAASPPIIPPLPMPPSKEPRHSLPPVGILPTKAPAAQWVVSNTEKTKYDDIFQKLDKDMDGLVSGVEVREIFLKTGLPSGLLAHIWALCDTKDCGKLTKEQFALAFHFISHKLVTGVDPPHVLTPEMIPPSERLAAATVPAAPSPVADFSAIKELDHLNNEIVDLQKEKSNVEQELNEKEEAVKQRTGEIQDLQDEVERESANLQKLQAHKQEVQEVLEGLDEQKAKLEQQLQDLRLKCEEENRQIASLKMEIDNQETQISSYEDELIKTRDQLSRLQEETAQLEENLKNEKERLEPLEQELQESQLEIHVIQGKLQELEDENTENHVGDHLSWRNHLNLPLVNGTADNASLSNSSSEPTNLYESAGEESPAQQEHQSHDSPVTFSVDPFDANQNTSLPPSVQESGLDFFQSDPFVDSDPFKDDPFGKIDPFGGDPFKDSDPFASDDFFKPSSADPFTSSKGDPFTSSRADPFTSTASPFTSTASPSSFPSGAVVKKNDPFAPGGIVVSPANDSVTEDPFASVFGNETLESGFADFSTLSKVTSSTDAFDATITSTDKEVVLSKNLFPDESSQLEDVPPALPPKTGTPTRPCPPPPERRPSSRSAESSDSLRHSDSFKQFNSLFSDSDVDPFTFSKGTEKAKSVRFNTYQSEDDMIEWAKRESEREEEQRLSRLKQQEQEDIELAIALSKSEISEA
ncbi:epidermal growth factor receptor substrate 15 isoform X1 [Pelobates cultripes]|uniref:Epidermal growth factor receptor substrate 15 isoform X1 n=1 Tax=Pelobates cultripes TaxID=61616 RepID=A0AAD1WJF4_PELCU|nr:epidermal growth factor receptor substrate 15 isoform X1 [Pelobates cultripes]